MSVPLTKVDSAIAGLSIDEKPIEKDAKQDKKGHKRNSSTAEGVWNIKDLGEYSLKHDNLIILTPNQRNKRSKSPYPSKPRRLGGKYPTRPFHRSLTYPSTLQETQHLPKHHRGQRHPQNVPRPPPSQEDRAPLPPWPGSHRTEFQGRHNQRRTRCHPQAVQEEGQWLPPHTERSR